MNNDSFKPFNVAAIQMNSQQDIENNLSTTKYFIHKAALNGAKIVVLPENFACFSQGAQLSTATQFEYICSSLSKFAFESKIWLVAGSLPCLWRPNGTLIPNNKLRSACLLFDPSGSVVARYDKIHLFDVKVADNTKIYEESATFEAGTNLVTANTPFGCIGLMICFDVRFPKLSLSLREQGANILSIPAAFTHVTGQMHWELLLRARAIDTQCLVIGAAQVGIHGTRETFGHSMIVDAKGSPLAIATTKHEELITANYNPIETENWRQAMPLLTKI